MNKMISDATGIECYCWESDGREPYGPKGTWKISPYNEKVLKIDGVKNTLYFVYGKNFVKWWLDNNKIIRGEFFIEDNTWFQTILYEIFRKIEEQTGTKIEQLKRPDGFGKAVETVPAPIKILWFSRHEMTESQKLALISIYGYYEIEQVNRTILSVSEISEEIKRSNVIAIVAPIDLQSEFLEVADGKPVIYSKKAGRSDMFAHQGWFRLKKIEIVENEL